MEFVTVVAPPPAVAPRALKHLKSVTTPPSPGCDGTDPPAKAQVTRSTVFVDETAA